MIAPGNLKREHVLVDTHYGHQIVTFGFILVEEPSVKMQTTCKP